MLGNPKTWMMQKLRLRCKDTTPLISQLMDHNLPLGQRMRLNFHLGMCKVCSFYKKQLEIIRALSRKLGGEETPVQQNTVLSEQAKIKIKESLKQSN